jgi:hypothetical protein
MRQIVKKNGNEVERDPGDSFGHPARFLSRTNGEEDPAG